MAVQPGLCRTWSETRRQIFSQRGLFILQDQLHKREEEHARERKNVLEQLEKERRKSEKEKNDIDKKELGVRIRASLWKYESPFGNMSLSMEI